MPERQPGRPTEKEFVGAARRFLANEYHTHVFAGGYLPVAYHITPGKKGDIEIIRQEWLADGQLGESESIKDFAVRQLLAYRKLKNGSAQVD